MSPLDSDNCKDSEGKELVAYIDVFALSGDPDFLGRCSACFASELVAQGIPVGEEPGTWTNFNRWALAAQPGFGAAIESARLADPPVLNPAANPAVISDAMILAAVQAIRG